MATIAVDLDEVLGAFVAALCTFHNEKYGTSLTVSDFFCYRFREVCLFFFLILTAFTEPPHLISKQGNVSIKV